MTRWIMIVAALAVGMPAYAMSDGASGTSFYASCMAAAEIVGGQVKPPEPGSGIGQPEQATMCFGSFRSNVRPASREGAHSNGLASMVCIVSHNDYFHCVRDRSTFRHGESCTFGCRQIILTRSQSNCRSVRSWEKTCNLYLLGFLARLKNQR
jgi:hypothetical protein